MISKSKLSTKKLFTNKLAIGGAIVATTAIVGAASLAGAAPITTSPTSAATIAKMCKDPNFRKMHGFKKVGDCVSTLEHQMGHGYGNNNTVNITLNAQGGGVINAVFNFLF